MKVGATIICVSLILLSFQPPIAPSLANTDGPTFPIEVSTDKFYYDLGEEVEWALTNVGELEVVYPVPPDIYVEDTEQRIIVDTRNCSKYQYEIKLSPGASHSRDWSQTYILCDESGMRLPPTGDQAPPGRYLFCAGADVADYGNQTMPLWDCVWIEILPKNEGPVANAGPDQTVYVGETVEFSGNESTSAEEGWISLTVDSEGDTGYYTSIALDSYDIPHISYFDNDNEDLRYGTWGDDGWNLQTVDSSGYVGPLSSIAIDSLGRPHISYLDANDLISHRLKYAKWTGTNWSIETVDSEGSVGMFSSLVLDSNDYPHISYFEWDMHNEGNIKYAEWNGASWNIETVAPAWGNFHHGTSLALDSDENPHISYRYHKTGEIKYAKRSGDYWSIETVTPADKNGLWPSLELDGNDNPLISFFESNDNNLEYAVWDGSRWNIEIVDSEGNLGQHNSLALDINDDPHISYFDQSNIDLKYAEWTGTNWSIETVHAGGNVGDLSSLALDSNGNPHISYHYENIGAVMYAVRGGGPLTYDWDFGDGSPHEVGMNPAHVYEGPGAYEVTLTVTDTQGRTDSDDCTITAIEDNLPPVADAGLDQTVIEGNTVTFDGTGSFDPDGSTGYGNWTMKASTIYARMGAGSATLNGEVYYISGCISYPPPHSCSPWSVVSKYNATTNTWSSIGKLPEPRVNLGASTAKGKIYAIGGNNGSDSTDTNYELDPATGTWTLKAPLPMPLESFGIASVNDKIYVMGGYSTLIDCYPCGSVYEYDPATDSWSQKPDLPTSRAGLAAAVLDDEIYAIGGDAPEILGAVEVYDPITEKWTARADMMSPRTGLTAEALGGYIFTLGGRDDWGYRNLNEMYDPYANNWTSKSSMMEPKLGHVSGAVGNCMYSIGGHSGHMIGILYLNEEYCLIDPLVYEWDFGDGSPPGAGARPTHVYADSGSYNVTLKVTDVQGASDTDSCDIIVLEGNQPPVADAGEDKEGYEVSTFTFDGSSTDPDVLDKHTYEWDFDYDGVNFDVDAVGQSVTYTWIDDFDGNVALRVTDDDGAVGIDTAHVLVKNVPPTVELTVLPIEVDVSLRIAGEKWHDVSIELYEDDALIAEGSLTRYPGSPNDQMLDLTHLSVDISREYSAIVRYTPEDDPVNGQPNGANPCWIILRFDDGQELWIHHTFNVRHPETYTWEVDLMTVILSHGLTFQATAHDLGADDLTFHWDFSDGTTSTTSFPNPGGIYPVDVTETITHVFPGSSTYTITLTVMDDDGGSGVATISVTIP